MRKKGCSDWNQRSKVSERRVQQDTKRIAKKYPQESALISVESVDGTRRVLPMNEKIYRYAPARRPSESLDSGR